MGPKETIIVSRSANEALRARSNKANCHKIVHEKLLSTSASTSTCLSRQKKMSLIITPGAPVKGSCQGSFKKI